MQPYVSLILPYLVAALFVFAIYRRFRGTFGRQPVNPIRMRVRMGIFVLLACFLLPVALRSGAFLAAVILGIAVGVGLALYGAARTRFEMLGTQQHYVPHTYTGVIVSLLFLGRLVYRLIRAYTGRAAAGLAAADQAFAPAAMIRSPLTVGLFFVLMSYYVCYYGVVLHKSTKPSAA